MSILLLIIGLVLFVGLVVVHEYGHYLAARRNGVEAEEFGIGFPPRAWKKRLKSGLLFSVNLLPIGGFVRLKGEHDADRSPGTFGAASLWAKTKIMLAGVGMNLLTAFVLLTLVALVGMPKLLDNQFSVPSDTKTVKNEVLVTYVEPGSPAEKAGLQVRDQIEAIALEANGTAVKITDSTGLSATTKKYADQPVRITIMRGNAEELLETTLRSKQVVEASIKAGNQKGYLGVQPADYSFSRSTWSAPIVALGFMKQFTGLTFRGLGQVVKGLGGLAAGLVTGNKVARQQGQAQASAQIGGPVAVFFILKNGSLLGYQFTLTIVAIISLTLAIINVLPIPALDGGRLFVMLLFRGLKKKLTPRKEEWIHGTGFALLMALFVLITIVDIRRFF